MIASRIWLLSATFLSTCVAVSAHAQAPAPTDIIRVAALTRGSISGVVLDERGAPVDGVVVSALGGTSAFAVTDRAGQYSMAQLPPGPYVVRAHREGYASGRSTMVNVRPSAKASSSFTLRKADGAVLTASMAPEDAVVVAPSPKDEGEVAWRLRRLKRSVLKEETAAPVDLGADDDWFLQDSLALIGRAFGTSARVATDFFADLPLYGQVNFLTAAAVDDAGELVAVGQPTGVAYFAVGAPVGDYADWSARVTMNSGDVTSWTMAGDFVTRATSRQRYAIGMTYSLQRYEGGTFAALQAVPDGHRKVTSITGSHDIDVTSRLTLGYGSKYEHYDYLAGYGLISPSARAAFALTPRVKLYAKASLQQVAPGAEEFVPPADAQWVPPQRTFSPLGGNRFTTEQVQHYEVGATRQFRRASVGVRAFRQAVDDQLVTVFGAPDPARLIAAGGHYGVASAGDARIQGWGVHVEHALAPFIKGSVDYALLSAAWEPSTGADHAALLAVAPRALRQARERLHDLTSTLEADISRTATRFVVLYKLNSGFAGDPVALQSADGRFDLQLRQGLPFLDVTRGQWEMLVGVRSLFRPSLENRSHYDELLVVRPPKRVMGGLQVRF